MTVSEKLIAIITVLSGALVATQASANSCTKYERQVYDVAKAVAKFRQTPDFTKTYGWSATGPYHQWLTLLQALSDDKESSREFLIVHGFVPMEIYSVADEFRTAGKLDSFYEEVDKSIKSLKCN